MKIKKLLVVLLFFSVFGCNETENLSGSWKIVEFRITLNGHENVSTTKTLNDVGAVWDLHFLEENKFRQNFNMSSPEMKMEEEVGTWKSTPDSLFLNLTVDSTTIKINYSYLIDNDTLQLTLIAPQTKNKVVSRFVRN